MQAYRSESRKELVRGPFGSSTIINPLCLIVGDHHERFRFGTNAQQREDFGLLQVGHVPGLLDKTVPQLFALCMAVIYVRMSNSEIHV